MKGRLRDLSAEDLDILQVFLSTGSFQAAIDAFAGTDYEAIKHFQRFVDAGILMIEG
jgi:hypothetical protein